MTRATYKDPVAKRAERSTPEFKEPAETLYGAC